jgi:hypothetical protein
MQTKANSCSEWAKVDEEFVSFLEPSYYGLNVSFQYSYFEALILKVI